MVLILLPRRQRAPHSRPKSPSLGSKGPSP
jgi:hypothetical protein